MKVGKQFIFVVIGLLALCLASGCAAHSTRLHERFSRLRTEETFMKLREIVNNHPNSSQAEDAQFSIAEYYYYQKDYHDALIEFINFVKRYPNGNATIFAKLYLLKIYSVPRHDAEVEKSLSMDIERELYSRPLFLLFSEYEKKSYTSPFGNIYEVHSFPEKVEVYLNGKSFYTITP